MTEEITFETLKKRKKPQTEEVPVCMDPKVAEEYARAKERTKIARSAYAKAPESLKEIKNEELETSLLAEAKVKDRFDDEIVVFKFRAIGREPLDELISEHPPTDEHLAQAKKENVEIQFNVDSFPPALIAASCTSPKLTEAQAQEIWDSEDWNSAELQRLYAAAMMVNQVFTDVEKLKKD